MTDIRFETKASWSGLGKNGEGKLTMGDEKLSYSSPSDMGGKGIGASPEDLLIGAVSTCYSGTLFDILVKKGLPVQNISVRAEGIVTGYPLQTKFERLIVHPTISGGDRSKRTEYEQAAVTARDKCFIGKSITGNIRYEIGTVQIADTSQTEDKIDELVDRFYVTLAKEDYFKSMFSKRNVDVEKLKERQKVFLARLIKEDSQEIAPTDVERVEKKHPFHTTPEHAEIWLSLMERTMNEINLEKEIRATLLAKMNGFMDKMIEA